MKNQMEIKFLELKKGNMSVTKYEAKFTELARFVPKQVDTEEQQDKRFQHGLQPWIRSRVAVFALGKVKCPKRKRDKEIFRAFQQEVGIPSLEKYEFQKDRTRQSESRCKQKGNYSNECPAGRTEVICFQCGKKGHVVRDCRGPAMAASVPKVLELPPPPQYNQPTMRTFNITMKEAV
ncbi:uncharacterized protein LOC141665522 [Apium graveolens]|uniref:uncharacterized protein LOC141665522 n=1 Tax=Apium graveolens TaxID=4045 RepID=UPI003D7A8451